MSDQFSPAARSSSDMRNVLIAVALVACVLAFFWVIGKTDRVTYLGPDRGQVPPAGQVALQTEPSGIYHIDRNAIFTSMKPGCRYDLNYAPEFGRSSRSGPHSRTKQIRSATLVDCP